MKYKNLDKCAGMRCGCRTWLEHWSRAMHKKALVECSVLGCANKAVVGGHVTPCAEEEGLWLIVPLCPKHNSTSFKDSYEIVKPLRTRWVHPDPLPTCKGSE
jgi:hypothetical protein